MTPSISQRIQSIEGRIGRIAALVDEVQGERIVVLDLRGISDFTDAFVIATARSRTHMAAILRNVMDEMRREGLRPLNRPESESDSRWTLLDYGNVIVHVFDPEARLYYDLENLWGDAGHLPWEELAPA